MLLDVDGTLVDSNWQHAEAWSQAFAEFGYSFSAQQIFPYIGMGGDKMTAKLLPRVDTREHEKMAKRHSQIFLEKYAPHVRATPGAHELVAALAARGKRPVIATSAHKDELEAVLKSSGLTELLDSAVTADDADRSKPDPDILEVALKKTNTRPDDALMVGDTRYDIEAAHRAGVQAIGLECGGHDADELHCALAVYVDPADLARHLDEV